MRGGRETREIGGGRKRLGDREHQDLFVVQEKRVQVQNVFVC